MIKQELKRQAHMELARRSFWQYCKFTSPDFYKEDRAFLKDLATKLQWFIEEAEEQMMVVNMPPRHGKSRTGSKLVEWVFGKFGTSKKVMTGSYNETLSGTFAKQVRNTIAEKPSLGVTVYSDIFPNTKIKYGEASAAMWALEGSNQANYLATSPTGTATGFGCNLMVIDDLIKSAAEAYNETTLKKLIEWFNNTMLSRTEKGFKIIIIMTRWTTQDLAGYVLENFDNVVHINYKAVQEDGTMLCEDILSKKDYELKTKNMNKDIVLANYQQEPIDVKGRLYTKFKTYTELPKDNMGNPVYSAVKNYTDTADTGDDFLCSINYVEYNKEAYVINVIYTKDGMEITEPAVAKMFYEDKVNDADIESNNGGRGFARSVESILLRDYGTNRTVINPFFQGKNKQSRILSNSTWVMEHIYFPVNWADRWPEYYKAMSKYQKEGKNEHDDAPDATTGIAEALNKGDTFSFD